MSLAFVLFLVRNRTLQQKILLSGTALLLFTLSCSSGEVRGAKEARVGTGAKTSAVGAPTQAELQSSLTRWSTQFAARMREAFQPVEKTGSPMEKQKALDQRIIYVSSATDAALGPIPEANLLDLISFVELCGDVVRDYWIPEVYGKNGRAILQVFLDSREQLKAIAARVMTPTQITQLEQLIRDWQANHPGQVAVEGVRLTEFAQEYGTQAKKRQEEVQGLLGDIQKASGSVDAGVLLGERALFYAQRAPFLYRMQARAATTELINSAAEALQGLPLSKTDLAHADSLISQLRGFLTDARVTLRDGESATRELRALMDLIYKNRNLTFSRLRNEAISEAGQVVHGYSQMAGTKGVDAVASSLIWKVAIAAMAVILFSALTILFTRVAYLKWARKN